MSIYGQRKESFIKLGAYLRSLNTSQNEKSDFNVSEMQCDSTTKEKFNLAHSKIEDYIEHSTNHNPWFTKEFLIKAIHSIGESLAKGKIEQWLLPYESDIEVTKPLKTIGVVMAGNIPLVGFHDYLCTLISGNKLLAKIASGDKILLPLLHEILSCFDSYFQDKAEFTSNQIKSFDAIIATGSDNTARYFEYYFGKYPNIIRKNRNGVGVLNGKETAEDLEGLADDVFMYFGLGCRNVSKLFVPRNYDFEPLMKAFEKYSHFSNHSKYMNNHDYNKAILLINKVNFLDNGFILLKEDNSFSSPISVLFYEFYDQIAELEGILASQSEKVQCLLSTSFNGKIKTLAFGKAQQPELWEYADGIDTLKFILTI